MRGTDLSIARAKLYIWQLFICWFLCCLTGKESEWGQTLREASFLWHRASPVPSFSTSHSMVAPISCQLLQMGVNTFRQWEWPQTHGWNSMSKSASTSFLTKVTEFKLEDHCPTVHTGLARIIPSFKVTSVFYILHCHCSAFYLFLLIPFLPCWKIIRSSSSEHLL